MQKSAVLPLNVSFSPQEINIKSQKKNGWTLNTIMKTTQLCTVKVIFM